MHRVGMGYDIHRFKKGRPLWLGGVLIPHTSGLDGHSDADALLHALIDALLGAAGLPDIGSYFPPSDPQYKNYPSDKMLTRIFQDVRKKGWRIENIDSVICTEAPKIAPYREAMRDRISQLLKISKDLIQIKGKTNEGLDAIGTRKALSAHVVVLLKKR